MQGRLDERGVWWGGESYEDVGELYQQVQSSPHVLTELSQVVWLGAGEVAEVRVASGDHH